jgi:UMF1 family MFS transporter
MDAANTAIIFLFLYARDQIGLSLAQFLPIYVLMATTSAIGSFFFGKMTDKFGHKKSLFTVLFFWIVVLLMLYLKTNYTTFLITGMVGGALLGGLWTITRPMLVSVAPKEKIAELFGYQGLTEKFSGVIGPALFGYIATFIGFRQALFVIIGLFLLGAFVLSLVKK